MSAVVLVLVVVLVLGVAALAWRSEQKRRERLLGWCRSAGLSYTARDDSWAHRWRGTPFGQGSSRRARNVLTGALHGRPVVAFDYTYVTTSTDGQGRQQRQTHRYEVVAVGLPVPLPQLTLTPENILSRIGGALGLEDIELESEDFNRAYRVRCPDRKLAYDVLHPRTMQLLLGRPRLNLRVEGADVVTWAPGRLDPVSVLERSSTVGALLDQVPSFVWADRGLPRTAEGAAG